MGALYEFKCTKRTGSVVEARCRMVHPDAAVFPAYPSTALMILWDAAKAKDPLRVEIGNDYATLVDRFLGGIGMGKRGNEASRYVKSVEDIRSRELPAVRRIREGRSGRARPRCDLQDRSHRPTLGQAHQSRDLLEVSSVRLIERSASTSTKELVPERSDGASSSRTELVAVVSEDGTPHHPDHRGCQSQAQVIRGSSASAGVAISALVVRVAGERRQRGTALIRRVADLTQQCERRELNPHPSYGTEPEPGRR